MVDLCDFIEDGMNQTNGDGSSTHEQSESNMISNKLHDSSQQRIGMTNYNAYSEYLKSYNGVDMQNQVDFVESCMRELPGDLDFGEITFDLVKDNMYVWNNQEARVMRRSLLLIMR